MDDTILHSCLVMDCHEEWQHSLHRSKKGAWKSGNRWLQKQHQRAFEGRNYIGKGPFDFRTEHQSFRVVPVKVED